MLRVQCRCPNSFSLDSRATAGTVWTTNGQVVMSTICMAGKDKKVKFEAHLGVCELFQGINDYTHAHRVEFGLGIWDDATCPQYMGAVIISHELGQWPMLNEKVRDWMHARGGMRARSLAWLCVRSHCMHTAESCQQLVFA